MKLKHSLVLFIAHSELLKLSFKVLHRALLVAASAWFLLVLSGCVHSPKTEERQPCASSPTKASTDSDSKEYCVSSFENKKSSERIQDRFQNFAELKAVYSEEKDYAIRLNLKKSPILITAIHGGSLEILTEKWARLIAGQDHSSYTFESLTPAFNKDLHITSARFDESQLFHALSLSHIVISIHGYKTDSDIVCMGGEESLKKKARKYLGSIFKFQDRDEFPCDGLVASNPNNFIYKAKMGGIQFEFPKHIREKIEQPQERDVILRAFEKFLSAILSDVGEKI